MHCKICKEYCKDWVSLYHHIRNIHSLSTKEYYDKHLKKKEEGICKYCGKKTKFKTLSEGYREFCSPRCASIGTTDRKIKTCRKNRGTDFPTQSSEVREKIVKVCNKKYNKDNVSQVPEVQHKKERTFKKHYGKSHYFKTEEFKENYEKTMIEKHHCDHPMHSNKLKGKLKNTNLERRGVECVFQDKKVQKKIDNTNLERYGFKRASKNKIVKDKIRKAHLTKEVRDKVFSHKRKNNHGYLSKSEYKFSKKLKKHNISFESEYLINENNYKHHFDFAIFKNNNLDCLVEIDGRYFHGLYRDYDGFNIIDSKDYLRWTIVPKGVKFLVINDDKLKEGFKELLRILSMKYKDWKKEMLRSIPKNIKDAIPKFDKTRMVSSYEKLKELPYNSKAFLGNSILLNFCKSRIIEAIGGEWKSLRKTLYKSPCSSHHLLEGFNIFKNPSQLREKFRKKYKGVKEVVVKHHSPEKMLAICSLGKTYISKEPIDKESKRIIKFLNLNVREI